MVRFFILALFFGGIGYIVFQMYHFYLSLQATSTQMNRDKEELREYLSEMEDEIIPIEHDELKLLSVRNETQQVREFKGTFSRGIFYTIYTEPIFKFVLKEYSSSDRSLLIIQTMQGELLYELSDNASKVYWDHKLLGILDDKGSIWNESRDIEIGHIDIAETSLEQNVFIKDQHVATIVNPFQASTTSQRLFTHLELLDEYDMRICLALVLLNVVERTQFVTT